MRSFEALSKFPNQAPAVVPDEFEEQRPLAKSQIIVADYVQGQNIDAFQATKKTVIKRLDLVDDDRLRADTQLLLNHTEHSIADDPTRNGMHSDLQNLNFKQ